MKIDLTVNTTKLNGEVTKIQSLPYKNENGQEVVNQREEKLSDTVLESLDGASVTGAVNIRMITDLVEMIKADKPFEVDKTMFNLIYGIFKNQLFFRKITFIRMVESLNASFDLYFYEDMPETKT